MRSFKIRFVALALLAVGLVPGAALAQVRNTYGYEAPMEGYYSGQAAQVNAAAAMIGANAAVAKAVGEATASNVKALESLHSARGRRLDNTVKATANFYEKRKLFEAYQALTVPERATREDLSRFSKTALPDRPGSTQLDANGSVQWPEVLLGDEYAEARAQIDYVFSQRNVQPMGSAGDPDQLARPAINDMRNKLRTQMQELSPSEYAATRRFLDSLTLELQPAPRPEALMKTAALPPAAPQTPPPAAPQAAPSPAPPMPAESAPLTPPVPQPPQMPAPAAPAEK